MKVLAKKFSPCRLSQYMIFCHKTHFCGRYSAPDLRQTGGPSILRGHFCTLKWYSQACIGLLCTPARNACFKPVKAWYASQPASLAGGKKKLVEISGGGFSQPSLFEHLILKLCSKFRNILLYLSNQNAVQFLQFYITHITHIFFYS